MVTRTLGHRLASVAALALMSTAGLAAAAPAASASGSGTACPTNRLCFYFNSDFGGARADFRYSDAALNNELFTDGPSGRNGWGVQVGNNAASVKNRTGEWVTMYDNRSCSSSAGWAAIAPGTNFNLSALGLKNEVSSIFIPGSGCISRDQSNQ